MIETLYRTSTPEKDRSECYVLILAGRAGSRRRFCTFMEEHGYWDAEAGCFVHSVVSIHADEQLTYEEGLALYGTAKARLAQQGFLYSLAPKAPSGPTQEKLEAAIA